MEESIPLLSSRMDVMNRVLLSALTGKLSLWVLHEGKSLKGIVSTRIIYDDITDTNSLLIYSMWGDGSLSSPEWLHVISLLLQYAKRKKCKYVTSYVSLPEAIKVAKTLGANTDLTFIFLDVDESVKLLNGLENAIHKAQ